MSIRTRAIDSNKQRASNSIDGELTGRKHNYDGAIGEWLLIG